jgi:hypothetical protein
MAVSGLRGKRCITLALARHHRLRSNGRCRQDDRNQHSQKRSDQATHHKLPYAGGMFLFKALHPSSIR